MDLITKHKLDQAAQELVASIDPSKVCAVATSFHPDKKPCRIFSEWKKGSYNVCFPVIFNLDTEESIEGEKWMVRIPLLPRLAFPEEKMRGEIATMKYIAEKTTIPIPHLYGYSITSDNALGLPFMLMEYVEGKPLYGTRLKDLDLMKRKHLYTQLGDVYLQLYQQQFDRIGALTLDENDHWIFASNRPLTVDINEQELSGLDSCHYLSPHQTFTSTIDYIHLIIRVMFNGFYGYQDSILDECDAKWCLYALYASRGILMEWVNPEYNHGPFILMHGDLRTPNIIIDDDFNIISILDWEWSHTVPAQLFVPPFWLTNQEVLEMSESLSAFLYKAEVYQFHSAVAQQEYTHYNPGKIPRFNLPLSKFWAEIQEDKSLLIAHGLWKPYYFGSVYWNALDFHYYDGRNRKERVQGFFELAIRQPELRVIEQKVLMLAQFEKERQELGIEKRVVLKRQTPEEEAELVKQLKEFSDTDEPQAKRETSFGSLCQRFKGWTNRFNNCGHTASPEAQRDAERDQGIHLRLALIGIGAISVVYISVKCKK